MLKRNWRSGPDGIRRHSASTAGARRGRFPSAARLTPACDGRRPRAAHSTSALANDTCIACCSQSRLGEFPEVFDRDRRHFEATPSLGQHEALRRQPVEDFAQRAITDAVILLEALQPELPTDFRPEASLVRFGASGDIALPA